MSESSDDPQLSSRGLTLLVERSGARVVIVKKVMKDFLKFERKDQRVLIRWMGIWCDGENHLPAEKFKQQDDVGGWRVDVFKAHQSRAYGVVAQLPGPRTFVITATDVKKQDKADDAVLDRAARIANKLKLKG